MPDRLMAAALAAETFNHRARIAVAFVIAAAVAMLLATSIGTIYFGFIEKPYLTYANLPFPVIEAGFDPKLPLQSNRPIAKIKPGQTVYLLVHRCNSDKALHTYTLARQLVRLDDRSTPPYIMPAGDPVPLAPGCKKGISAVNVIPAGVTPGTYYLDGIGEVNGTVRNFSVRWYSQPFEVIP